MLHTQGCFKPEERLPLNASSFSEIAQGEFPQVCPVICNLRIELIPLPVQGTPDQLVRNVKHRLRDLGQGAGLCILPCGTRNKALDF